MCRMLLDRDREGGREGGERGASEKRVVRETETHRIVIDYLFFKVT